MVRLNAQRLRTSNYRGRKPLITMLHPSVQLKEEVKNPAKERFLAKRPGQRPRKSPQKPHLV